MKNALALSPKEAANVRAAARFLRARMGGWLNVASALHVSMTTAKRTPTPILAFRLARLVGVVLPLGGQTWFYKLTGDAGVVAAQKAALIQFVQSAKYPAGQ